MAEEKTSHHSPPPIECEPRSDGARHQVAEFACSAGQVAMRGLAALREVDWATHAGTAVAAATSAVVVARCALVSYGPEALAAIAAATDRPTRVPFRFAAPFSERVRMSQEILGKFSGHVPVIVEKMPGSQLPEATKQKFLVPASMTNSIFVLRVLKNIRTCPSQSIFLRVCGSHAHQWLAPGETIGELYARERDADGFLYLQFREESVFG